MSIINLNCSIFTSQLPDDVSLDNKQRLDLKNSRRKTLTYFRRTRYLDARLETELEKLFCERCGYTDAKQFHHIWVKVGKPLWNPHHELTMGKIREIDRKFMQELVYHGKGITAPDKESQQDKRITSLIRTLLHGEALTHNIVDKGIAKAVFVNHDPYLMDQFRQGLQHEMNHLAANPPKTPQEEVVWRAFLGNMIGFLPFAYPENGETFSIPILQDGICRLVPYEIEVIPLQLTKFSTPMTALGMTPKDNDPNATPILAYLGTTFPAGNGFATTIMADFTPGHSVGEAVYKINKERINNWLADKQDVHAIGLSLGGAMVLNTLEEHHDKIARADLYNPPGLYPRPRKYDFSANCAINIYCQAGDLVSMLGAWPTSENISLYTVYSHQSNVKENIINSHVRAFTGCDQITVLKENPAKVNAAFKRKLLTKLHQFLAPFLIFIPVSIALFFHWITAKVQKVAHHIFSKL